MRPPVPPLPPPPSPSSPPVTSPACARTARLDMVMCIAALATLMLVAAADPSIPAARVVGHGGFGTVVLGEENGVPVAIKQTNLTTPRQRQIFAREREMHQLVLQQDIKERSGRVVSLIRTLKQRATDQSPEMGLFVMEYCSGGSVVDLAEAFAQSGHDILPKNLVIRIAFDLSVAMHTMHTAGVIHRDIKPRNIVVDFDQQGRIFAFKLIDFGLAHSAADGLTNIRRSGTASFQSPESWLRKPLGYSTDVFSFAMTLYGLCSSDIKLMKRVFVKNLNKRFKDTKHINEEYASSGYRPPLDQSMLTKSCPIEVLPLIEQCWNQSADQRPKADQIVDQILSISEKYGFALDRPIGIGEVSEQYRLAARA